MATFAVQARDSFGNFATFFKSKVSVSASFNVSPDLVKLFDSFRNVDEILAQYSLIVSQDATVSMQVTIGRPDESPFYSINSVKIFTICLSTISAPNTYMVVPSVSLAGSNNQVKVHALNAQGVHLIKGGDSFSVSLSSISPDGLKVPVSVVDNSDGTYTASFTVTTSGTFSLSATLGNQALDGSPKTVHVAPGPTWAALTILSGNGANVATAGVAASMQIRARDEYGNARSEGGDSFGLEVVEKLTGARIQNTVSDLGDGTYAASYLVTRSGQYEIGATILSVRTSVSPAVARVLPSIPVASMCTTSLNTQRVSLKANVVRSFDIYLKDRFANIIQVSDLSSASWPSMKLHVLATSVLTILPQYTKEKMYAHFSATVAGDYLMEITVGGQGFSDSPITFHVEPAMFDVGSSRLVFPIPLLFYSNEPASFSIELADRFQNIIRAIDSPFVSVARVAVFNKDGLVRAVTVVSVLRSESTLHVRTEGLTPCTNCRLSVSLRSNGTTHDIHGSPLALTVERGPGPYMVNAQFSEDGAEVAIDFSVESSLAAAHSVGGDSCANIFQESTAKALGKEARCIFVSKYKLLARLGIGSTIVFHSFISLKSSTILSIATGALAEAHTASVRPPSHVLTPEVQIEGPCEIGRLDSLVLSSVILKGSGGRETDLQWSLELGERGSLAIRNLLAAATFDRLAIPPGILDEDVIYTFALTARNWMGRTSATRKQVHVQKAATLPILLVPGAPLMHQPYSRPLILRADIVNRDLDPAIVVAFRWRLVDGPTLPSFNGELEGKSQLYIPADELKGASSILIEVSVSFSLSSKETVTTSQLIQVDMLVPRLEAHIAGGSRTISVTQQHIIDASASIVADLDTVAIYLWQCTTEKGIECFTANSDIAQRMWSTDSSTITLLEGSLIPGIYTFSVTVVAEPGPRKDSASVKLEVVQGQIPSISLSSNTALQADGNGWLLITSIVDLASTCAELPSFQWSVQDTTQMSSGMEFFRIQPFPGLASSRGPFAVRLNVECSPHSVTGVLDIKPYWGPSMGAMHVNPSEGTAVSVPFAIAFQNFIAPDDDYPLFFSVYQDLDESQVSEQLLLLLVSGRQSQYHVVLSPTGNTNASILGVVATASGVTSASSRVVRLLPHAKSLSGETSDQVAARESLYIELELAVAAAMQNYDAQSTLQIVVAACSILNSMTQSARRPLLHRQLADSDAVAALSSPQYWPVNSSVNLQDSLNTSTLHVFQAYTRVKSWLMPSSAAGHDTIRTQTNQTTRESRKLKAGFRARDGLAMHTRASNDNNIRSYFLGVLKSAFDISSRSQEDLGSFAVALSILMQDSRLESRDVNSVVSLLNDIAIGTTSSLLGVPDWHSTALVKSAGNAALLLNTHVATLSTDYAVLSNQIQNTVGRTTDMLGKALFVGEAARRIRSTQLSLSISKFSSVAEGEQISSACLPTSGAMQCVQLTVPRQLTGTTRRQLVAVGAVGGREVLVVKIALWKRPLYLLPALYDKEAQGPMVQFDVAKDNLGGSVQSLTMLNESLAAALIFRMDALGVHAGSLSSCRWFDPARRQWRRQGLLARQARESEIECIAIAQLSHLAVLSEQIVYDTHSLDVPSSYRTVTLGEARQFSSLVTLVLLIVIASSALIATLGLVSQALHAVSTAMRRSSGVDTSMATNRIAPEDEFIEGFLTDYEKDGSIQSIGVILLSRHPLLSLIWSAPRAEARWFARLLSFLVTLSGIMVLVMLLFACEFANAPQWLETGILAGLAGIPLYYMVMAPFGIGRRLRALATASSKTRAANTNRILALPALPEESQVDSSSSRPIRSIPVPSSALVGRPQESDELRPTRAQHRAAATPTLDMHHTLSMQRDDQVDEEEELYSRPGTGGETVTPTLASATFTYAPDATAPLPTMPAFASPGGDEFGVSQQIPNAGELPSSMFKEFDLLSVAAHKLNEHQSRHPEHDDSMSPIRPSEVDWTYTPCPSPRDISAPARSSRPQSRRTSGRSTPTAGVRGPLMMMSSRSLARAAGARQGLGINGPRVSRPPSIPLSHPRAVPDSEDARLHMGAAASSPEPPLFGIRVTGGNFGARLTELVIPPAPPPSPRLDQVRASAIIAAMDTSPTLQAASDYLQDYPPPPQDFETEEAGAGDITTCNTPQRTGDHHQSQHLPGAINDDEPIDPVEALSASPHFTNVSVTSPIAHGRMSPGELGGWSPDPAPSREHFLNSPSYLAESPGLESLEHTEDSLQHTDFVTKRLAVTTARGHSPSEIEEEGEENGARRSSRRRERAPPRPRNLEPILGSLRGADPWQLQSITASEQHTHLQSTRQLSTIPQEEGDEEYEAVTVQRESVRTSPNISLANSLVEAPGGGAGKGQPMLGTHRHDDDDHTRGEAGGGDANYQRLQVQEPSPLAAIDNGSGEQHNDGGYQNSLHDVTRSPNRSPRRRRREKQSAASRWAESFMSRAIMVGTGVIVFCGAILLALAAVLRALLTFLGLCIALFPVAGPLLQVFVQLAVYFKATELLGPSLRPGLDEAWLRACAVAVGEWQIFHALSIVLQVVVVRRIEATRLQDRDDDMDHDDDDDDDSSDMDPQERNAA